MGQANQNKKDGIETINDESANGPSKGSNKLLWLFGIIVILGLIWFLVRPGVFTIQPIGAIPEGVTFIYHSRNPNMPFFSSPDGMCLQAQGSVSLLCRASAMSAANELTDRMLLKLPYIHWTYLRSTGGSEFER